VFTKVKKFNSNYMSRIKDEIDKGLAAPGVPSEQFNDYKGAFFRLQQLMEIMSSSSIKEIEEFVNEMNKDYGKYFATTYCIKTVACKILLSNRPNDPVLKERARNLIDSFSDPGYMEEFEKNIG
jgi:hypothetical protein